MKRSKLFIMSMTAFLAILLGISGYIASTAEAASNFASIDVAGAVSLRNCDCSQDRYDCSDFASQDDAQACYWTCGAQNRGDVHKLDLDVNMVACDVEAIQPPSQPNPPPPPSTNPPSTNPPPTNPPASRPPLKAQLKKVANSSDFSYAGWVTRRP